MTGFEIAAIASASAGALNKLFGADPDEENRKRMEEYQKLLNQRTNKALAAQSNWKGFYDDAASQMAPRFAFAGQQAGLAADAGASTAQANLRRSLGAGGEAIGSAIGAGIQTGADLQQASLRSLAESDIIANAQRMAQARAGLIAQGQVAPPSMFTGQKNQQTTNLFGNLATSLGSYGQYRNSQGGQGVVQ